MDLLNRLLKRWIKIRLLVIYLYSEIDYAYCFRGGGEKEAAIIYEYNENNHKQFVKVWFEGFSGAVHSDADPFFGALYVQDDVESLLCNLTFPA